MTGFIPSCPHEITPQWLTDTLRAGGQLGPGAAVADVDAERIGEGVGFVGLILRLRLRYEGLAEGAPATVIAKMPSPSEGGRALASTFGLYEREVRFYRELAAEAGLYTPRCYCAEMDPACGRYMLLLEDLAASGRMGDQVEGCSPEDALLAVSELARFHATWWESPRLAAIPWLQRGLDLVRAPFESLYPAAARQFVETMGQAVPRELAEAVPLLGERMLLGMEELEEQPTTILHGDYRLDNMFFGEAGAPYRLALVDWQSPNRGPAMYDLAYFISTNLSTEQRRACEDELLGRYHETLVAGGVRGYAARRIREDYRRMMLVMLAIGVINGVMIEASNERAAQLFDVTFERLLNAIIDLRALELLPEA